MFFLKEISIEKVIKSDLDNIKIDGEGIELSKYLEFFYYFINVVCFICNKYSKDGEYLLVIKCIKENVFFIEKKG